MAKARHATIPWAKGLALSHLTTALSSLIRRDFRRAAAAASCCAMYATSAAEIQERKRAARAAR